MNKEYLKTIEKYLKSKNLSPLVFDEVYDHFVIQIAELMDNGNDFQEAFVQVKLKWKYELEMVKADVLSFRKIARIEKELLQIRFRKIIYSSVFFSMLLGGITQISDTLFFYFEILVILSFIFILMYSFFWKKMSFREYRQMSFHPLLLRNIIAVIFIFPIVGFFSKTFDFLETLLTQLIVFYGLIVQIQLLYFRTKKINVLLS